MAPEVDVLNRRQGLNSGERPEAIDVIVMRLGGSMDLAALLWRSVACMPSARTNGQRAAVRRGRRLGPCRVYRPLMTSITGWERRPLLPFRRVHHFRRNIVAVSAGFEWSFAGRGLDPPGISGSEDRVDLAVELREHASGVRAGAKKRVHDAADNPG